MTQGARWEDFHGLGDCRSSSLQNSELSEGIGGAHAAFDGLAHQLFSGGLFQGLFHDGLHDFLGHHQHAVHIAENQIAVMEVTWPISMVQR